MANKIPEHSLKDLLDIVAGYPEGVSSAVIAERLATRIPHRTLQYRLNQLVGKDRLQMKGSGRWARYHLATTHASADHIRDPVPDYNELIPLSDDAKAIRDYVQKPVAARKPVGYNRDFLEHYRPNETFYLEVNQRANLERLGQPLSVTQPAGTYARLILNRLLIDLAWNSSRLEGNTYSLLDTKRLIEFGEQASGRDIVEAQMILNHKDAIEFLVGFIDEVGFNAHTFLNLHALLSNNLLADTASAGRLRHIAVGIEQSAFHPLELPQLIEACFNTLLSKAAAIENPFEQAFFLMVHIPYLQPFDDVNKRVSRLAANIPLIRGNLSPISFTDVPQRAYTDAILGVYELNDTSLLKEVFIWAYERSAAQYTAVRQSLGDPDPFRLKYRVELKDTVKQIVRSKTARRDVAAEITRLAAKAIRPEDRATFATVVEDELLSLHEGNFARYQVRPSEFAAWQEVWGKA